MGRALLRCVTGMVVPAIGLDAAIMEPDTKEPLFEKANIERATALKSRAFVYTNPHSSNPNVTGTEKRLTIRTRAFDCVRTEHNSPPEPNRREQQQSEARRWEGGP